MYISKGATGAERNLIHRGYSFLLQKMAQKKERKKMNTATASKKDFLKKTWLMSSAFSAPEEPRRSEGRSDRGRECAPLPDTLR